MRMIITFSALFLSVILLQLSSGGVGPLDALSGIALNFTTEQIGLLGSAHFLGFFIGCWSSPRLLGSVGHSRAVATFTAMGAIGLLGNFIIVPPQAWGERGGGGRGKQAGSPRQSISVHVDNLGCQPCNFQGIFSDIDVFLTAGCQQHIHLIRVGFGRALDFKIDRHFIKGVRNVLIRFQCDLVFHLKLVKTTIHLDNLGDHRRAGNSNSHLCHTGTLLGRDTFDHFPNRFDVCDVFFNHCIGRQWLYRIALDLISIAMF